MNKKLKKDYFADRFVPGILLILLAIGVIIGGVILLFAPVLYLLYLVFTKGIEGLNLIVLLIITVIINIVWLDYLNWKFKLEKKLNDFWYGK